MRGLVGYAVSWFVTVVLPVLLMILATFAGAALTVWILRVLAARFGWGRTLSGAAFAVGVPALVTGYIMAFTGDFETPGPMERRTEPDPAAADRGTAWRGENLWLHGDRPTRDTLHGRFVRIEIDDTPRQVRLSELRYQRGLFMSVVGLVTDRADTASDDATARVAVLEAPLEGVAARIPQEGFDPLVATTARIEAHEASVAFERRLQDLMTSPGFARRHGLTEARKRAMTDDHRERLGAVSPSL